MRSRALIAPKGTDTRPTLDCVRESLFNILMRDVAGAKVLDLYAGSGALALEALSRGAQCAVLCDCSREAAKAINQNIASLHVEDRARCLCMPDTRAIARLAGEGQRFDLVFLDPPYRMDTAPACALLADAGVLIPGALIVIEHLTITPPAPDQRFTQTDRRNYKDTTITFYQYTEGAYGGAVDIPGQL